MDRRIFDLQDHFPALAGVSDKFLTVGYVVDQIRPDAIVRQRDARALAPGDVWAVASAGGGQHGEALVAASCDLAIAYPDIFFDVVIGERSNLSPERMAGRARAAPNLRLHHHLADMATLHASADIVVSSGGYNSLLESLQGQASIVCIPSRKSERDEQFQHAARLRRFAAIDVDIDINRLPAMFADAAGAQKSGARSDQRRALDFDGAANIRQIVLADMGMSMSASDTAST